MREQASRPIEIMHFSDPHHQTATMRNLELAAHDIKADVAACTGDCATKSSPVVPSSWDHWPHTLKVAVPGNHDYPHTFANLQMWKTRAPWCVEFHDLLFAGIDSTTKPLVMPSIRARPGYEEIRGIVILSHHLLSEEKYHALITGLIGCRAVPVLVLHGHNHPRFSPDYEWEPNGMLGEYVCSRSRVTTCSSSRRGLVAVISWQNGSFAHRVEHRNG